eukprot:1151357-Rhodomonas_salina.1
MQVVRHTCLSEDIAVISEPLLGYAESENPAPTRVMQHILALMRVHATTETRGRCSPRRL